MTDNRVRVPLDGKRIDLDQLTQELGVGLCASDTEVVIADPKARITAQQLKAAVKAHKPEKKNDGPLSDDEIKRLRALISGSN